MPKRTKPRTASAVAAAAATPIQHSAMSIRRLCLASLLIPTFLFVSLEMVYFKKLLKESFAAVDGSAEHDIPSVLSNCDVAVSATPDAGVPSPIATSVEAVGGELLSTNFPIPTTRTQQRSLRYHEIKDMIDKLASKLQRSLSSFSRATVVDRAPWMPQRKLCKATCCVETRAVSLDQDAHKIINTDDGRDLADLSLNKYKKNYVDRLQFQGENFHQDFLPCLVPGTVFYMENHNNINQYFWRVLRPEIKVPFVLIMSGTDGDTPASSVEYASDPLLIKVYGTNPFINSRQRQQNKDAVDKFVPMGLGLSRQHPQEQLLLPYLELNNFTNPFLEKERWNFDTEPLDFDRDVFVHFGLHREGRLKLFSILCPNTTTLPPSAPREVLRDAERDATSTGSCSRENTRRPTSSVLGDMSKFRFAISPVGVGWDCYRTYELLLMGVIPIIQERIPESHELFQGLPIVHMANMDDITSKQDFVDVIQQYIKSDAFQKANFEQGWQRLFLEFRRTQVLKDANRTKDILKDEQGREYYQAFHYTFNNDNQINQPLRFCSEPGDCETPPEVKTGVPEWMQDPVPKLSEHEANWLKWWEETASAFEVGSSKGFPDFPKEEEQVQ